MSGTSMDGLDMCLAEVSLDNNYSLDYKIINTNYEEFDNDTIEFIRKNIVNNNYLDDLNQYLGKKYLDIVKKYYSKYDMDLISMHGQTINHINRVKSVQAGNPKFLHDKYQVPVIYNFRYADIQKGGTGAPLMPFLDWLLFKKYHTDVITLNIGGISNISCIRRESKINQVIGFDTGPGMSLIDEFVLLKWNVRYDSEGLLASKGKINSNLLILSY